MKTITRTKLLMVRRNNKNTITSMGTFYSYMFILCVNKQQKSSLIKIRQRWVWSLRSFQLACHWLRNMPVNQTWPSIHLKVSWNTSQLDTQHGTLETGTFTPQICWSRYPSSGHKWNCRRCKALTSISPPDRWILILSKTHNIHAKSISRCL